MEGATNLFENSKNETKALSIRIEKLATQVSRMEEKLLEEQQEEEKPSMTEPPPQKDASPASAKPDGETTARQPDAPLLSAEDAWEVAARIRYALPEPLPGSSSSRFPGWYNDGRWGSALYQKEIPCAGISLEKKEVFSIAKEGVNLDVEDEAEKDEPEEEIDKKNEEAQKFVTEIREMIRETSREELESSLKNMPGVFSVNVDLDDEDKTLANGVAVNVEMFLDEEFGPIIDVLLRDGKHDDHDIIRNLETITKFVDDIKTGSRDLEEISQEWDFDNCVEVMKGERKNAGLRDPT